MLLKPGARPARALPMGAPMPYSGPLLNNGWVALRVLPKMSARNAGGYGRAAPHPDFQRNRYG